MRCIRFAAGLELDRRRGLSSDYRRYSSRYTARTEASFRDGYLHGWHGR